MGLVPRRVEVQVVAAAEVPLLVVLPRGGQLRVTARADAASFAEARIVSGETRVDGSFRNEQTHDDVGDQLVGASRFVFDRGLEPGNYVLRWRRGSIAGGGNWTARFVIGSQVEIPFTVSAGEVKDLEVKLE
jgi:hypothetical protein